MHYTLEEKAEFLRKFSRSAGGAAAFCRRHKLNYTTFLKWRRDAEAATKGSAESMQFVELEVKRAEAADPLAGPGAGPAVELILGGGMILRIYPSQAEGRP
jgi:transposase-like protein